MPKALDQLPEFDEIRSSGMKLASNLVLEHNYDLAKEIFGKLLEISPEDVEVMTLHANIFFLEGKLLEAERGFDQVLALNPNYPLALYLLGAVYHEKGEYEKAIHMYEMALKYFPQKDKKDIADVYQNMGCSLWEVGKREEALEAWKTCLKYNPKQKYAKENLKDFTNEYGLGKSSVGMDDFWAFVHFKRKEFYSVKGICFKGIEEANTVLKKITAAWDNKILPKYGAKLDRMKTQDKIKLFNDTRVFTRTKSKNLSLK
ncbi:MAG TPA: tetratricopeptide repeat protein [Candidatus Methylomirabilis sp.]|nr:tetratricopeptide repeat protein [Candidatus Methylomirabilis sp.]